jgi:hypothetical protein
MDADKHMSPTNRSDDIYEPLSDLSLGALGLFIIIFLVVIVDQMFRFQRGESSTQLLQKVEISIAQKQRDLQAIKVEMSSLEESIAQNSNEHELENINDEIIRPEVLKELISLQMQIIRLEEVPAFQAQTHSHKGRPHLEYTPHIGSVFLNDDPKISLSEDLSLSLDAFDDVVSSFVSNHGRSNPFFIYNKGKYPLWLKKFFDDKEYLYIDVELKETP